jgi:hypothetical protein
MTAKGDDVPLGTQRIVEKFLWFPLCLFNHLTEVLETRWMVRSRIIESVETEGDWNCWMPLEWALPK